MSMQRYFLLSCFVLIGLLLSAPAAYAQFTLLLPDQPTMERDTKTEEKAKENKAADKAKDAKSEERQMDVLIAFAKPSGPLGLDMDMPQMFAVIRHHNAPPLAQEGEKQDTQETAGAPKAHRQDLLGELEEIRYLDKKAWAANVSLDPGGLYQLITETRPWWDEQRDLFQQHFVKTVVPVYGMAEGWDSAAGLKFEILPLVRPFGMVSPALFTGKVLLSGNPLPDALIKITRLNTERLGTPAPWQDVQEVKTGADGVFSFVCPTPGWWGFMALTTGDPLKGPDGQLKKLEMGAVTWVYVDEARTHKNSRPRKP